jgi:hypothetical protein
MDPATVDTLDQETIRAPPSEQMIRNMMSRYPGSRDLAIDEEHIITYFL